MSYHRAPDDDSLTIKLIGLASDWEANGNSRELGDPSGPIWHKAARQLRDALREHADA